MVFCPECQFANTFWGKRDSDGEIIEHYGRRCQGVVEKKGARHQCDYRFRYKECERCNTPNDIAARRCHHCDNVIIDPDTKLREALALKDALVLRCAGMTLEPTLSKAGRPQLKVTYHDEDRTELAEYFSIESAAQKGAFNHKFLRQHLRNTEAKFQPQSIEQVIVAEALFRAPEFVVARKKRHFWIIQEKLFDYEGRYRQANQLLGGSKNIV